MPKIDIASLLPGELRQALTDAGEKPFRARQIFHWLHSAQVFDFAAMSDLPLSLREKLSASYDIYSSADVLRIERSSGDETVKYLFRLSNNTIIESVLMLYKKENTVCISTQAGCRMGCVFCASGLFGLERHLTASEMCAQVYAMPTRVNHIVLMGMGEPLDNYDNTVRFIRLITHPDGFALGARHITLSTCGIVPAIYKLADEFLPITLAVSLHAPSDVIRLGLMPIAKKYSIDELIGAAKYYGDKTKRRVTYEYALIRGVNDSLNSAAELAKRLKNSLCHVNLISVNEIKNERRFQPSNNMKAFAEYLRNNGVETTIRRKLGGDISAACGQLRSGQS